MNVVDCIKDYLLNSSERHNVSAALAQAYAVTKDEQYKEVMIHLADVWCDKAGVLDEADLPISMVMYHCYLETKDERYRSVMEQLHNICNGFLKNSEYPELEWVNKIYMAGPFTMAYDTAFCNKEHYNEIIEIFENTYSRLLMGGEISLPFATTFAMAVIDTMEVTSKEIFEHYKALERIAKKMIHSILDMTKNENSNYQVIDKSDREKVTLSDLAKASYVILKACRMKVILAEKYQATGMELLESVLGVVYDIQDEELKLTVTKDEVMAVVSMAYAQKLSLDSTI